MSSNKTANFNKRTFTWMMALVMGWLALIIGLYTATLVGKLLEDANTSEPTVQLIKGIIISIIVLIVTYNVQTRMLNRSWKDIFGSNPRHGIISFLIGAGLAVGLAILGFVIASWQGWITIVEWHISPQLLGSIAINMMFAFLYEALPEEVALRGFVYNTLKLKLPAFVAFLCQLGLFVLVPIAVAYLQFLSGMGMVNQISVDYIVLLLGFGTTLQLLRSFTGSLWTSIGFHLAYLEISRFAVLQREQRLFTFEESVPGAGELFVLFFMTVIVAAIILGCMLAIRRFRERNV